MKEKEEMMMMMKVYIREKAGIQRMSDALQLEKQSTEKESERKKTFGAKQETICEGKMHVRKQGDEQRG